MKARIARVSPETLAVLLEHRSVIQNDRELYGPDLLRPRFGLSQPAGGFPQTKTGIWSHGAIHEASWHHEEHSQITPLVRLSGFLMANRLYPLPRLSAMTPTS